MKAHFCKERDRWRIIVPARLTETHKRQVFYFLEKQQAEAAIREKLNGYRAPKISKTQEAALLLAENIGISEDQILEAVRHFQRTVLSVKKPGTTLEQACVRYIDYHVAEKSNRRTRYKYCSTLRRLCADLSGNMPLVEITKDKIVNVFLKRWEPGVTRRSQWQNVKAFLNWAVENEYLAINPISETKSADTWESNKEILPVEDFRRILFACAEKFPRLLPYFVLGGMGGLRRAEMISSEPADRDPRIEWSDIDFKLNKIKVRHEVAKETNAADRRRSIPLEPAARAWLQLVAKTEGPVIAISQSTLQRQKEALLDSLGLKKLPDNALRNSYASYGAAFRSIGDVARAMGDLEVTIKRYYVDLVDDPELGRAWFSIRPDSARKIVPMVA